MVGLLSLASQHDCEEILGLYVLEYCTQESVMFPTLEKLRRRFGFNQTEKPVIEVKQHNLQKYDELMKREIHFLTEASYV